jgi:hypothetical protein
MAQIVVIPEAIYRKRGFRDETERQCITADQLVNVLNSASEAGSERREYILLSEKVQL